MTTENKLNSPNQEKQKQQTNPDVSLKGNANSMRDLVSRRLMPLSLRPTKSIKRKDSVRPSKKY